MSLSQIKARIFSYIGKNILIMVNIIGNILLVCHFKWTKRNRKGMI